MMITYKEAGWGGGEREAVPINERIEAFAYLVGFLATFAMSTIDSGGMEALQRLQSLWVRL